MNAVLKRQLAKLDYIDPEELLRSIMPTMVQLIQQPEKMKHLSDHQKGKYFEKHQAAFLAFMMKHVARPLADVKVCVKELEDFDCVIKAEAKGYETVYKCIQLKQLSSHPADKNPNLQTTIDRIKKKYPRSSDLTVCIWINRNIVLDFCQLDFKGLNIEQLWFTGDDSQSGGTTLDGGHICQLLSGVYNSAIMIHGKMRIRPIRFKPCHHCGNS